MNEDYTFRRLYGPLPTQTQIVWRRRLSADAARIPSERLMKDLMWRFIGQNWWN